MNTISGVVKLTYTKLYKKTVVAEINLSEFPEGITDEQIDEVLYFKDLPQPDFDGVEAEEIEHPDRHGYIEGVDEDRYDIYRDGKKTYGGHL